MEIEKIRQQLMDRIDTNDFMEVKKVERYCELLALDKKCEATIEEEGVSIVTKNGTQHFVKSHPSIGDRLKINAQLIALEKSINFIETSATTTVDSKGGGLI